MSRKIGLKAYNIPILHTDIFSTIQELKFYGILYFRFVLKLLSGIFLPKITVWDFLEKRVGINDYLCKNVMMTTVFFASAVLSVHKCIMYCVLNRKLLGSNIEILNKGVPYFYDNKV